MNGTPRKANIDREKEPYELKDIQDLLGHDVRPFKPFKDRIDINTNPAYDPDTGEKLKLKGEYRQENGWAPVCFEYQSNNPNCKDTFYYIAHPKDGDTSKQLNKMMKEDAERARELWPEKFKGEEKVRTGDRAEKPVQKNDTYDDFNVSESNENRIRR